MSSLKNLRSRFHKHERDRSKDSRDGHKPGRPPVSHDEVTKEDSQSSSSLPDEEVMSSLIWHSQNDQNAFEEQLNQLQENLVMVMIENQTLKNELNASRNKTDLELVKAELAYERRRREFLEHKLKKDFKIKNQHICHDQSDSAVENEIPVLGAGSDFTGSKSVNTVSGGDTVPSPVDKPVSRIRRFYHSMVVWILCSVNLFLDDFTEECQINSVGNPDGDPLTVKKLKENIKRFGTEAKPYVSTVKGIGDLLVWRSPAYTLIVFAVYMYSVWQGWFLPLLLFCLSFRLFINYLRDRGWNISFNFFDTVEEANESEEKDLSVTDKFNLVMHVARKVQNVSGELADSLEKIKSLLTWRHPEASRQLLLAACAAFITSCIMSTSALFFYTGLVMGIKLFIIDYIYKRFPRVRRKYDSSHRLWMELPTDAQYERQSAKPFTDKEKKEINPELKADQVSVDDHTFCELFSLPKSEHPLPGWHGGRRCTLINRGKSLPSAFKNGRLYLTHRLLCFERTKVPSPKNIVIPLADIARLEKSKPYSWMPGSGMAIEITVVSSDKSYIFGAMINRDELFESIVMAGRKAGLPWSTAPCIINETSQ